MSSRAARQLTPLLLAAGCMAAGCSWFRSKPATDPAGALFLLERDLFAAIQKKDVPALQQLLADDFVLRTPGAPDINREVFIAGVVSLKGTLEITGDGLDARIIGETGVITGIQRGRVHLNTGRVIDDVQSFTDVALRRDGRWQVVLAHSTPVTAP